MSIACSISAPNVNACWRKANPVVADEIATDPIRVDAPLEDPAPPPPVLICPGCSRSLVVENGALRFATADDTVNLSPERLKALRAQRTQVRKAQAT